MFDIEINQSQPSAIFQRKMNMLSERQLKEWGWLASIKEGMGMCGDIFKYLKESRVVSVVA